MWRNPQEQMRDGDREGGRRNLQEDDGETVLVSV